VVRPEGERFKDMRPEFGVAVGREKRFPHRYFHLTCCMSKEDDAKKVEMFVVSAKREGRLAQILGDLVDYHRERVSQGQVGLGLGHTINMGIPWLPGSRCTCGYLSHVYFDYGGDLEKCDTEYGVTRILWLLPITPEERKLALDQGYQALEALFEKGPFDYTNPLRDSLV